MTAAGRCQAARQIQQQAGERLHIAGESRRPHDREATALRTPRSRAEQASLADARFARHKQQLAGPGRGLGQPPLNQGELAVPADQDRRLHHIANRHRTLLTARYPCLRK
jgi:hypothetical protein